MIHHHVEGPCVLLCGHGTDGVCTGIVACVTYEAHACIVVVVRQIEALGVAVDV